MLRILVVASLCACSSADDPIDAETSTTATYSVTFISAWSAGTHPKNFPASAHFSPFIGGAHQILGEVFAPGKLASPGIKSMAETGATQTLANELTQLSQTGLGLGPFVGAGIGSVPGSATVTVMVNESNPLVTVVSMIAPSPDWFVAADNVNLRNNNEWRDSFSVSATHWDAGTDSGSDYTSANQATLPADHVEALDIMTITGSNAAFGVFEFIKQ